jgi:glycosyltransferase involved in cell wall biosynthesis
MNKDENGPLFSVIIPVYNGEKYIAEAIQSVFDDDWDSFEVIVIDDGSIDATAAIVKRFPEVIYKYQENKGVATARNEGLNLAKGAYIAFLDADDIWLSGRFAKSYEYLMDHPDVDYLLGMQLMFLEPGIQQPAHINDEMLIQPTAAYGTCVMTGRKSCFERVGLFNPAYRTAEDSEWMVRANEIGLKMVYLPYAVIKRRVLGESLSVHDLEERKMITFRMMKESIQRKKAKQ